MPYLEWRELTRSVELPLLLGLGSLLTLFYLFYAFRNKFDVRRFLAIKSFHADESGATYSVAFLMVFPFILFLMIVIFETTFIFLSKLGTVHAAYAAARVASVHLSNNRSLNGVSDVENEFGDCERFARQAAIQGMVPFSTALYPQIRSDEFEDKAQSFWNAWSDYIEGDTSKHTKKLSEKSVKSRYHYAAGSTDVALTASDAVSDELVSSSRLDDFARTITVEVSYKNPFRVPFMKLLLNGKKENGRAYLLLQTSATVPVEAPKNDCRAYGIRLVRAYQ